MHSDILSKKKTKEGSRGKGKEVGRKGRRERGKKGKEGGRKGGRKVCLWPSQAQ
jgi:hypothetical protein